MDISEAPAALEQPGAPSTAYFFDTGISLYRDHQTVQTPFDDSGLGAERSSLVFALRSCFIIFTVSS